MSAPRRSCWPCSASRPCAVWASSCQAPMYRQAASRRWPASPTPSRFPPWPGCRRHVASLRWWPLCTAWRPAPRTTPSMFSTCCCASCSPRPRRKTARSDSAASRTWIGRPRRWPRHAGCCSIPACRTTSCASASTLPLGAMNWPRPSMRFAAWYVHPTTCSIPNWRLGRLLFHGSCQRCCAVSVRPSHLSPVSLARSTHAMFEAGVQRCGSS